MIPQKTIAYLLIEELLLYESFRRNVFFLQLSLNYQMLGIVQLLYHEKRVDLDKIGT